MPLLNRNKGKSGTPEKKSVSTSKPKTNGSTSLQTPVKSNSSTSSNESMGIGNHRVAHTAPPDAAIRFRLMPEGLGTNVLNVYDQVAYDCLVTVVTCSGHGTVALTAPSDWTRMYGYFPFIPLQDTFTWKRISRDGLALIFKSDAAIAEDETFASLPDYLTTWLGISRVQLPNSSTTKFCKRILQHVQLQTDATSGTKNCCCIDNSRIRWIKLADVAKCENLWSDEVIAICKAISGDETCRADFISEIDGRAVMSSVSSEEHLSLLNNLNWSEKVVSELLEDYVRHMYPAMSMSVHSFDAFLQKYGLVGKKDKRIGRLFRAFASIDDAKSLAFPQLLIGLAVMDPETANDQDARAKFIFNYYDTDGKEVITKNQVKEMIREATSTSPSTSKVTNLIKAFSGNSTTLNLGQFTEALRSENIASKADGLLRFEKSFFEAKKTSRRRSSRSSSDSEGESLGQKKASAKTTSSSSSAKSKSSQAKAAEGNCFGHTSKKYEFGLHTVRLDSTGRCVDQRIINEHWVTKWGNKEMSRNRYSVENIFRINSTASIFIDLVRDFTEKQMHLPECRGMLTAEENMDTLYSYLETLARQTAAVLRSEPKLLRLGGTNNSVFVVGELQGSLPDLMHIESALFPSAPVSGNTLLFLGNYTGPTFSYGFEVLLYLFALKVAMPNKIYLLRGKNEMRLFNTFHLKSELVGKFGEEMGDKIWSLFNSVFDCLPVAAILYESIFCTHSGIPKLAEAKKFVSTFQAETAGVKTDFADPKTEMPIGYELMVNIPARYAYTEEEKEATKAHGFEAAKSGAYHYYSSKAFEKFMNSNAFRYFIRSHNPAEEGYALCFNNRCLTVYSVRRFNKVTHPFIAVLMVGGQSEADWKQDKIRIIRFPTPEMTASKKKNTANR